MEDRQQHWDRVYGSKAVDEVSWFQASPDTSARLLGTVSRPGGSVIDVGAGTSTLVDTLLEKCSDATVSTCPGRRSRRQHTDSGREPNR